MIENGSDAKFEKDIGILGRSIDLCLRIETVPHFDFHLIFGDLIPHHPKLGCFE